MLTTVIDPGALITTRVSWHTLAERVLAPARHAATGRIGLTPTTGGFATPELSLPTVGSRRLAVIGSSVVATLLVSTLWNTKLRD